MTITIVYSDKQRGSTTKGQTDYQKHILVSSLWSLNVSVLSMRIVQRFVQQRLILNACDNAKHVYEVSFVHMVEIFLRCSE